MLIEIREQAREDLKLGFQFYEEQAPGLGHDGGGNGSVLCSDNS